MAITNPTVTKEGLRDFISTYYTNSVITVFLINDHSGILTPDSTFSSVVGLELYPSNGYTRKIISVGEATILNENNTIFAFAESNKVLFTATNGNIPLFTHVVIAKNTSTTPGNTDGTLIRIEPIAESGMMLKNGESYEYQFQVEFSLEYE